MNSPLSFNSFRRVAVSALIALLSSFTLFADTLPTEIPEGAGPLVIAGGGVNQSWDEIFGTIVDLKLEDRPLAIFGTGQSVSNARPAGENLVDRINTTFGEGTAIYVHITSSSGGNDPDNADAILSAGGVFFIGGSQTSIMNGFTNSGGTPTPALEAIWEIYAEGAVIAGSSAGAAIMSDPMISGGTSSNALARGATPAGSSQPGVSYRAGMGFNQDAVYCQHHIERGRFGRLLAAVVSPIFGSDLGIGIAEDTALLIDNSTRIGTVIGGKGSIVIDASEAELLDRGQMTGVKVHYLDRGDRINLLTREIYIADGRLPANPSQTGDEITVGAWGTNAIYDLMVQIMDTQGIDSGIASDTNFDLIFEATGDTQLLRMTDEADGVRPTWSVTDMTLSVLRRDDEASHYLHDWHFEEAEGTEMSATLNSARPWVTWNGNLADSFTTGDGTFRIQRNAGGLNRRVDVGETDGAEILYMLVDFAGWNLADVTNPDAGDIEIRMHFMNGEAADNPGQITAGMRLIHNTDGTVSLQADSTGTAAPGGETSEPVSLFSETQLEDLKLVTAYNTVKHSYSVYYQEGDGDWVEFFAGNTSGLRAAISFRMWIRGDFYGDGLNYMDLNRFAVTTFFPDGDPVDQGDSVSIWDELETINNTGFKDTNIGIVWDQQWPWVYHAPSHGWIWFNSEQDLTEDAGIWGYHVNASKWIWVGLEVDGWVYEMGESSEQWTPATEIGND
ncbi:MAG: cyanophycinase [Opitutales bacterium]|nr:cyanophycinase [Opitutales bacterium]